MQIRSLALNSINNISNNLNKNVTYTNNKQLSQDIFIRNCSFKGDGSADNKSFDSFKNWANEVNFVSFADEVINKTGRILGSGLESKTYAIPCNDDWVIRQYNRSKMINEGVSAPKIVEIKDIAPNLNVGQFVASIQLPVSETVSQQFYVLKRQTGESIGVPYSLRNDVDDNTSNKHLTTLRQLSRLPQESFDKLIKDIIYVTDQGYKFDCSDPGNFLFDEDTQKINFINVENKLGFEETTQFGDVLFALLGGEFAVEFNKSDRPRNERDEARILSQKICSMFMISMIRKNQQFTFSNKFQDVFNSKSFEAILGTSNQDEKIDKLIKLGLC